MNAIKESDVFLYPTPDGANLQFEGGQPLMEDGFDTAIYLSLVGPSDWWGNTYATDPEVFQGPISDLLLTGALNNQKRLDIIAKAETLLAWMVRAGIMKSVTASAFIETPEQIKLTLLFTEPDGQQQEKKYRITWTNQKARVSFAE